MSELTDATFESLALAPILDLKAASPLRGSLLERRGHHLELDAADVQRLGGLWRADGLTMRVGPRSEAFVEALRLFGGESAFVFQPEGAPL